MSGEIRHSWQKVRIPAELHQTESPFLREELERSEVLATAEEPGSHIRSRARIFERRSG